MPAQALILGVCSRVREMIQYYNQSQLDLPSELYMHWYDEQLEIIGSRGMAW